MSSFIRKKSNLIRARGGTNPPSPSVSPKRKEEKERKKEKDGNQIESFLGMVFEPSKGGEEGKLGVVVGDKVCFSIFFSFFLFSFFFFLVFFFFFFFFLLTKEKKTFSPCFSIS